MLPTCCIWDLFSIPHQIGWRTEGIGGRTLPEEREEDEKIFCHFVRGQWQIYLRNSYFELALRVRVSPPPRVSLFSTKNHQCQKVVVDISKPLLYYYTFCFSTSFVNFVWHSGWVWPGVTACHILCWLTSQGGQILPRHILPRQILPEHIHSLRKVCS